MCLIVHRPSGQDIPFGVLANGIADNPHGWGILRKFELDDGTFVMTTERGFFRKKFWKAYDECGTDEIYVHFRYATHGKKNVDNCHPFSILDGKYHVIHNGVIDIKIDDNQFSDTWHFAHRLVAPLLENDPSSFGTDWLEDYLLPWTKGSKVVIVRHDGAAQFFHRNHGFLDESGVWYSNLFSHPKGLYAKTNRKQLATSDYEWSDGEYDNVSDEELAAIAELADDEMVKCIKDYPEYVATAIQRFFGVKPAKKEKPRQYFDGDELIEIDELDSDDNPSGLSGEQLELALAGNDELDRAVALDDAREAAQNARTLAANQKAIVYQPPSKVFYDPRSDLVRPTKRETIALGNPDLRDDEIERIIVSCRDAKVSTDGLLA